MRGLLLGLGLVAGVGVLYATRKLGGPRVGNLVTVDTSALLKARFEGMPKAPNLPDAFTMRVTQISKDGKLLSGYIEDEAFGAAFWGASMKDVPLSVVRDW